MKKIGVFIIDDSALVRKVLTNMLDKQPDIECLGSAPDPIFALKKMEKHWPDVIVLDVEMPRMNGLEFLKKLMAERPTPTIMCSTSTSQNSANGLEALAVGAIDVVEKPKLNLQDELFKEKNHLIRAIHVAAKANMKQHKAANKHQNFKVLFKAEKPEQANKSQTNLQKLIVIGSSTGGTAALERVLKSLPKKPFPPIVVVQHMPETFTKIFADRLNGSSYLTVVEAVNGVKLSEGHVHIAPGGKHTTVIRRDGDLYISVKAGPKVNRHCPSVDVLFQSAANLALNNHILAIIMTGMGDDGAAGMESLFKMGAETIGQDKNSCVVYGMPAAAKARNAVKKEVPLERIALEISRFSH